MSDISAKLEHLQRNQLLTFATYGDSAYIGVRDRFVQCRSTLYQHDPLATRVRKNLENVTMSSCREVIEWDYGDVGTIFSFVDYKKRLRMRESPVGLQYLTAMILRNAMVCMRGCNTSQYFSYNIPDNFLYTWTGEGPRRVRRENI